MGRVLLITSSIKCVVRSLGMRLGLLFIALSISLFAADYDLLVRNARVIDGTGNPWFRADVAVKGGRIAGIGKFPSASADRVIDAAGRVLAPGFIDVHTHIEGDIEKIPRTDNFLLDGVTTVVTGNCGGSRLRVADWFAGLEKLGTGINIATLIGHNTVRSGRARPDARRSSRALSGLYS